MIQRDMKAILRLSLLNIVDSLDLEEQVRKRRQFSAQELLPGVKTIVRQMAAIERSFKWAT
jgi:hypothetical protein